MKPNVLVTFTGLVTFQAAVLADGDQAAYFAAAVNTRNRLMSNPDVVADLASRGLAILDIEPADLVSVKPIKESNDQ